MKTNISALFSITIAASVLLSGLHAKELPALSTQDRLRQETRVKKTTKDDAGSSHAKVTGEVHNHVEKQTLKSALKVFGDQNMQADARHLKRQRNHAQKMTTSRRLKGVFHLITNRTTSLLGASA